MIKKNFTIIETNNIDAFAAYKNNAEAMTERLGALLNKAQAINMQEYSLVSRENLSDAMETAELMLDGASSCDELQSAYSALLLSVNNLTLKHGEDTQKGALNITAGKVIAAVLVGTAILAAQIYMYKMQKNNKSDKRRK